LQRDYHRTGRSVSLLYAHLVFVTQYRRRVLTDAILTDCESTRREVCDALGAELVEFKCEADHVHLLIRYPPALAISTLVRRSKGRDRTPDAGRPPPEDATVPGCTATSKRTPTSRTPQVERRCRSSSSTSNNRPAPSKASPASAGHG